MSNLLLVGTYTEFTLFIQEGLHSLISVTVLE